MTQNDPFAAADMNNKATDRAAAMAAIDPSADPFAVESEVLGAGGGVRGPQWFEILDRLVVLKPVEKKLGQPVPNQPDQKQDFWSVDLTVLDGEKVSVYSPEREYDGKTYEAETNSYDTPFTFPQWFAFGKAITVKLDNLKLPLFLGIVKRCPTGPGYRKGQTHVDSTKAWDTYMEDIRAGRPAAKPQFSWGLIDPSAEQRATALAWYRELMAGATQ